MIEQIILRWIAIGFIVVYVYDVLLSQTWFLSLFIRSIKLRWFMIYFSELFGPSFFITDIFKRLWIYIKLRKIKKILDCFK